MNLEDRELFLTLGKVNSQLSAFGVTLQEGLLISADDQVALGHQLVDLAEAILKRSEATRGEVVEGSVSEVDTKPEKPLELLPAPEG